MTRFSRVRFVAVWLVLPCATAWAELPQRFARFRTTGGIAYGLVEGDNVREIEGDLFGDWKPTDTVHSLDRVELLVPSEPTQVFAMAGNYRSHLAGGSVTTTVTTTTVVKSGGAEPATVETSSHTDVRVPGKVPEPFQIPQPFLKPLSCLTPHDSPIVIPEGAGSVHYEAEMVVVIGKKAKNVSVTDAPDYVFGVTCGNDVSERDWQKKDVQWWRAKGADTFGPCGPFIVTGLNYNDLLLKLRLNGELRQHERTKQLVHSVAETVSFISQYVTLMPGDLIFTGTSGTTSELKGGDVVEVELEGVGVLRNRVVE